MATPEEEAALNEVMQFLEAEPVESTNSANSLVSLTNNDQIPVQRGEKLAILVSTGKSKEAIGVQLTHDQVKRLSDKDVQKYSKRYKAYIGNWVFLEVQLLCGHVSWTALFFKIAFLILCAALPLEAETCVLPKLRGPLVFVRLTTVLPCCSVPDLRLIPFIAANKLLLAYVTPPCSVECRPIVPRHCYWFFLLKLFPYYTLQLLDRF